MPAGEGVEVLQGHPRSFSRDHRDGRSGLNLHGLSAIREAILGAHRVALAENGSIWIVAGTVRAQLGSSRPVCTGLPCFVRIDAGSAITSRRFRSKGTRHCSPPINAMLRRTQRLPPLRESTRSDYQQLATGPPLSQPFWIGKGRATVASYYGFRGRRVIAEVPRHTSTLRQRLGRLNTQRSARRCGARQHAPRPP
jgi:hypothetical protein